MTKTGRRKTERKTLTVSIRLSIPNVDNPNDVINGIELFLTGPNVPYVIDGPDDSEITDIRITGSYDGRTVVPND